MRQAVRHIATLAGPAALILIVAAAILWVFGEAYAEEGETLLLILVGSALFDAGFQLCMAYLRIRGRLREAATATWVAGPDDLRHLAAAAAAGPHGAGSAGRRANWPAGSASLSSCSHGEGRCDPGGLRPRSARAAAVRRASPSLAAGEGQLVGRSKRGTIASGLKLRRPFARPRPHPLPQPASPISRRIAAASASRSPGGTSRPVSPSTTMSRRPPMSEATTGLPAAAASRATRPNGSGQSEGATVKSERRSASIASGAARGPARGPPDARQLVEKQRPIRTSGGGSSSSR